MEQKMCKNKKCQRILPEGYKHKYCENCMTVRANNMKKTLVGAAGAVGSIALFVATKGKHGGGKA